MGTMKNFTISKVFIMTIMMINMMVMETKADKIVSEENRGNPGYNGLTPENSADSLFNKWRVFFTGIKSFTNTAGSNYGILIKHDTSSVVRIVDTSLPRKISAVLRLDHLHPGKVNYDHININRIISGIRDPHLPLPPGGLPAGTAIAQTAKVINQIAGPLLTATEGARIVNAVYNDYNEGTMDNTKEIVIESATTWAGGLAGAQTGGAIGTLLLPGVGTIVGGILGAMAGSNAGDMGGKLISDTIVREYERRCNECCQWSIVESFMETFNEYIWSDYFPRKQQGVICNFCKCSH